MAYEYAFIAAGHHFEDPRSLKEVLQSKDRKHWLKALDTEHDKIRSRDTFVIVNRKDVPKGQTVLSTKPVFKTKRDADGNITKYKARVVVRGFEQQYGKDFDQTFAGVVRGTTWKIVIAVAVLLDLEIEQMDAVAAFLNGDMDGEAYIELPEGWKDEDGRTRGSDKVGLLLKALYGLKQAPRLWQRRLRKALAKIGFYPLKSDNAIYRSPTTGAIIPTHVDDFLIIGIKSAVADAKAGLSKAFHMEDLGPARHFVGVRIVRDRTNRTVSLVQDGYIEKVLTKFDMLNCSPYKTPMEAGAKQILQKYDGVASPAEIKEYQSIVGSEMYLAQHTRTDISYAVGKLSQFLSNPSPAHIKAARRVLSYLAGTTTHGVTYGPGHIGDEAMRLVGYADSDYAGLQLTFTLSDPKSTSGYVFYLAGGLISAQSKRQSVVAQSTTESEYYGVNSGAREAAWLRQLLIELDYNHTDSNCVLLHGDNQGSLALDENPEIHFRTKHIAIKYHYIREQIDSELLKLNYVSTKDMRADGLTKPLPAPDFLRFIEQLRLSPIKV